MSRDYEEYCPSCKEYNARSNYIKEKDNKTYVLFQCLVCGDCFMQVSEFEKLETKADYQKKRTCQSKSNYDEKIWKLAQREVLTKPKGE